MPPLDWFVRASAIMLALGTGILGGGTFAHAGDAAAARLPAGLPAIAVPLSGTPGALVCENYRTLGLVFHLYTYALEDALQDQLLGTAFTIRLRGAGAPVPVPAIYGCALIPAGDAVSVLAEQPFTIIAGVSGGRIVKGVTLPAMVHTLAPGEANPFRAPALPSPPCLADGAMVVLQGTAARQPFQLADGSQREAWVLSTSSPICVREPDLETDALHEERRSRFQIIGLPPPAAVLIELTGTISTGNYSQYYAESVAMTVIRGRRVAH